jgi:hypothetical protein
VQGLYWPKFTNPNSKEWDEEGFQTSFHTMMLVKGALDLYETRGHAKCDKTARRK